MWQILRARDFYKVIHKLMDLGMPALCLLRLPFLRNTSFSVKELIKMYELNILYIKFQLCLVFCKEE